MISPKLKKTFTCTAVIYIILAVTVVCYRETPPQNTSKQDWFKPHAGTQVPQKFHWNVQLNVLCYSQTHHSVSATVLAHMYVPSQCMA